MPLGNGDIGMNLWVEENGDLLFYISKTDSFSEHQQLLKIGRVRVHIESHPFSAGEYFRQVLDLSKGMVSIEAGPKGKQIALKVWVDTHHPVIRIEGSSEIATNISVSVELWRNAVREVTNPCETHSYMMQLLEHEKVMEFPDTIVEGAGAAIRWYHRNESSAVGESLKRQGLEHMIGKVVDPLKHLTFGARIQGTEFKRTSPTKMEAVGVRDFKMTCTVLAEQTEDPETFISKLDVVADSVHRVEWGRAEAAHEKWWNAFWDRSWIRASGGGEALIVTRAYQLQRYMHACSARGKMPIKFNGSIFTTCHEDEGWSPDYRLWGGSYWTQNTRLSYWPMLMDGDFEMMHPFFDLYWNNLPIARERAKQLGCQGAVFPETMTLFGTCNTENYGYNRPADLTDGLLENTYLRRYWQGSIEIATIMLEYYQFTEDTHFAEEKLVPFAMEVLRFYKGYYTKRDELGKILFSPSQSLETWQEAVNPTPDIAGLQWLLNGLLGMAEVKLPEEEKQFCREYLELLPPLPTRSWHWTGKKIILPALQYDKNLNWENPELYAVFPYRLYGVGKPELERGVATFNERLVKMTGCWTQDAIQAALLGLTDDARRDVVKNASQFHPESRFPAFWDSGGNGFDWIPDQDHGGVTMIALQRMVMQCDDGKIHLFPAWPKDWDVAFKLHAPGGTVVEGTLEKGVLKDLKVTPTSREKDVVNHCEKRAGND
ncbi:MAG: DUF5703 domain-containing protein [Verrucomicrobiota bacterium]|nr:DUF5703 domain-containing protein [Verrucomicrobiota bacterium]